MSEPLTPQTPGADPTADLGTVDRLAAGTVAELIEGLDALSDTDLAALAAAEKRGKNRTGAIDAITRLQAQRDAASENDHSAAHADPTAPAPIGDTADADKPASAVDPRTIERPVLTRDGWVLPLPRAQAQG